jgi:cytosine/adenosine deaminase-related metal-dependent hydrolase
LLPSERASSIAAKYRAREAIKETASRGTTTLDVRLYENHSFLSIAIMMSLSEWES